MSTIKFICPYCGSGNTKTAGGETGDPFDRRPEKTVCLDCGRTVCEDKPPEKVPMPDISAAGRMMSELEKLQKKPVVVIEMTASAAGVTREARAEFPYKDGVYSFENCDYPFTRFGGITIRGDTVDFDGEVSKLTNLVLSTEKHFIAYGPDRYAWDETVKIRIYTVS